jgi:trans-aconitate methyltransferase
MPENNWNATLYDQKHAFVFEYGKGLLALLDAQPGEVILDLGCGTGHHAQQLVDAGARVVGIDGAASMIETARKSYPEIEFQVMDARNFSFPYQFDAIFSNAVLHWIPEAEQVIGSIAATLKPGGRFVAEFGGKGNTQLTMGALGQALQELAGITVRSGWYFPSIGEYAPLLEKHGLEVNTALLFDRPTRLEDGEMGLRNWIRMFGGHILKDVPDDMLEEALKRTETQLRPALFKDGAWYMDYRRLRIVAHKA